MAASTIPLHVQSVLIVVEIDYLGAIGRYVLRFRTGAVVELDIELFLVKVAKGADLGFVFFSLKSMLNF